MKDIEIVDRLIRQLGGAANIAYVTNCMTRLRIIVREEAYVREEELRSTEKVLGLVHDRPNSYEIVVGPGNSRKFADLCHGRGVGMSVPFPGDWKRNKEALGANGTGNPVKNGLKVLGDIFVPLIPGVIVAGLCAGFASLMAQLIPDYKDSTGWYLLWQLLMLINISFMTYITAWAGYRAAERFAATPILGGMLGMMTSLQNISEISRLLGLYNEDSPLSSILQAGKGGILAVICGVFIMSHVERFIRRRMPANLDVVFTPLLTMFLCVIPHVLIVMPAVGLISAGISWTIGEACVSNNVVVRAVVGYVASAVFLPLVACGMHHGMIALYTVQLQELGCVLLYPALAMAGAGQVGAALALYVKAKRLGHRKLCAVIGGALPAGVLGVGEPLIYGVTLPMGRPFLTAGLGAGFGGAFVTVCEVASTTWGPSGLLGVFVMTAGRGGALQSAARYVTGLAISCGMAFLITMVRIKDETVAEALGGMETPAEQERAERGGMETPAEQEQAEHGGMGAPAEQNRAEHPAPRRMVRHGESILIEEIPSENILPESHPLRDVPSESRPFRDLPPESLPRGAQEECRFSYTVKDPVGMHARPAGALAGTAAGFRAEITIRNGERTASAKSILALMELEATKGCRLEVCASGEDAAAAAEAVQQFLSENL